jgi:hypothetical protein
MTNFLAVEPKAFPEWQYKRYSLLQQAQQLLPQEENATANTYNNLGIVLSINHEDEGSYDVVIRDLLDYASIRFVTTTAEGAHMLFNGLRDVCRIEGKH